MNGRICTKCGNEKPPQEFQRNGKKPDGSPRLRSVCKPCGSRFKTERPEARRCTQCKRKKEAHEFQGKRGSWCRECANAKTYEYRKGPGRVAHNERMSAYNRNLYKTSSSFRRKHKARQAVIRAVKNGEIVRPKRCPKCGRKARLHAHHHNGYSRKSRFDILWLCPKCHYKEERAA